MENTNIYKLIENMNKENIKLMDSEYYKKGKRVSYIEHFEFLSFLFYYFTNWYGIKFNLLKQFIAYRENTIIRPKVISLFVFLSSIVAIAFGNSMISGIVKNIPILKHSNNANARPVIITPIHVIAYIFDCSFSFLFLSNTYEIYIIAYTTK